MLELLPDLSRYKPLKFDVLSEPGEEPRVTCTSQANTRRILELSYVTFSPYGPAEFPEAHQALLDGESMEEAFAQRDIRLDHDYLGFYRCALPAIFGKLYDEDGPSLVKNLQVLAGPHRIHYANLLQTFTPDYQREIPYQSMDPTPEEHRRIRRLAKFLENLKP
jgi:hypothetical protein